MISYSSVLIYFNLVDRVPGDTAPLMINDNYDNYKIITEIRNRSRSYELGFLYFQKFSQNKWQNIVKKLSNQVPWNREVFSLAKQREAMRLVKRRNAREPLGVHVRSFERADPITSRS